MGPVITAFLAVVIAVSCIFLAFRFGKLFFKAFVVFSFLVFIGIVIYVSLMVNDATSFEQGMQEDNNLYLLVHNDNLVSAVILRKVARETGADIYEGRLTNATIKDAREENLIERLGDELEGPYTLPTATEFNIFKNHYNLENFQTLSDPYHKMFIFDSSIFDEHLDRNIRIASYDITVREALNALDTTSPDRSLPEIIGNKYDLLALDVDEVLFAEYQSLNTDNPRSPLLMAMLYYVMPDERDTAQLVRYFQTNHISVYPETILFKTLNGLPETLGESLIATLEE